MSAPLRIPQGDGRGSWHVLMNGEQKSASVACPKCGHVGTLLDHSIAADGTVQPSVACYGCDFHEHVVLEGWAA